MTLERMHWHNSFSVGVYGVDEQHRRLFAILNRLIDAVDGGHQASAIEGIFNELVRYTKTHFKSEEALFRGYTFFREHHAEHIQFENDLAEIRADNFTDTLTQSNKLLEFLTGWLKNHILNTDISTFNQTGMRSGGRIESYEERLRMIGVRPQILVVEDSTVERKMIKYLLENAGFQVLEASCGHQGIEILKATGDIHLVITDLEMPDGDGFELIRDIRDCLFGTIYIIVVTGLAKKESLPRAFRLGANDFLSKPIMFEELLLRVRNGLNLMRVDSQDELIFAMAKLSDFRSSETGQHLERVQHYTRTLGLHLAATLPELQLTESTALDIARFSPLHDIGKVAIPDAILGKPGRLTPEEFETMKDHARIGGELIGKIITKTGSRNLGIAYALTMHHHERWDGSGYPMHMAGETIPLPARITALADVYDALTSARSYKSACSREEARGIIATSSGQHFDPRIVTAFREVEEKFQAIREDFSDDHD
jgi:putative two-component system response regulator